MEKQEFEFYAILASFQVKLKSSAGGWKGYMWRKFSARRTRFHEMSLGFKFAAKNYEKNIIRYPQHVLPKN